MKTIDKISKYNYTTIGDISDEEYKYDESFNLISMKDTFIEYKKYKSNIFQKDHISFGIDFIDKIYTKRNKTISSISNFSNFKHNRYAKSMAYYLNLSFIRSAFKPIIKNMRNISTKQ